MGVLYTHSRNNWNFSRKVYFLGITKLYTHLHPVPSTSIHLHPPPPSSFQPSPSSIHLHPANFSLHPALCNPLNVIRTKIMHVTKPFPQIQAENFKVFHFDRELELRFLKFLCQNSFFGKFALKKLKLSVFPENWLISYFNDADSYSDISFLNFQPKSIFGQSQAQEMEFPVSSDVVAHRILRVLICFI